MILIVLESATVLSVSSEVCCGHEVVAGAVGLRPHRHRLVRSSVHGIGVSSSERRRAHGSQACDTMPAG